MLTFMLKKFFSHSSLNTQHSALNTKYSALSTQHFLLLFWFAVGTILRFINLDAKPPWTDEFSTLVFSLGNSFLNVPLDQPIGIDTLLQPLQPRVGAGVQDVLKHLFTESNHPPLYFILTHLWLRLFPTDAGLVSVWGARALAALFGAMSVPAIYALSFKLYRSRLVSHLAAAFMATSPYAIFLAQETRHYTLPILWVMATLACFISAVRHVQSRSQLPIKVALTWIVVNALGIATHYFFVLTLCCEAIVLLFLLVKQIKNKELESVWYRIFAVAAGTASSGAVWIPVFLQNSYGGKLTEWIQGDRVGLAWLSPIFQGLAAWITMISLLPVESPRLAVMIASGVVMLAFFIWATPVLVRGLKARLNEPENKFITKVLIGFIISALLLFAIFTYFLGIDLTRGARYNFIYFPAVIILVGASLAICWRLETVKMFKWRISGKKAVLIIWLMSLASGITVVNNLGYQKYYRPDLFIGIIQRVSSQPVLIATTQKTHVHIGEMMGVARELKKNQKLTNTKFLLAHQDDNPSASSKTLGKAVKTLPRPFDLWKVNFFADDPEELETCSLNSKPLPAVNGYEYKVYRCR
ncbi:putative membrane protein [Dulcicalothrix desertica PCC 7102]|nr:putative membrane protein [Dulcicalothrix desertica PCC 7102]